MSAELIMQIVGYFVGGAAVYAAIKSDLTRAIVTSEMAIKSAERAHDRLDQLNS